jgi:hypothetical protein
VSLLATIEDFEQGGLYGHPDGRDTYGRYVMFGMRVTELSHRFAPNGQKLAIWGCGWGYLVDEAVTLGYDAYGFDAAAYAINKGKAELPQIASRLFVRDALVASDVDAARGDAGIHGNRSFALLVTEELLTSMSDAEIAVTLPLLRGISQANLLHIVSISAGNPTEDSRCNWKTAAEWVALLEPPDVAVDPQGAQL